MFGIYQWAVIGVAIHSMLIYKKAYKMPSLTPREVFKDIFLLYGFEYYFYAEHPLSHRLHSRSNH